MTSRFALAIALAATASCTIPVTASSNRYLAPEQTGALTNRSVAELSREVVRLFEIRGYALFDQHVDTPDGELLIKFARTDRSLAAAKSYSALWGPNDVGSVFYAWISPAAIGSAVRVLGKPTVAGYEPCTADAVELPCTRLEVAPQFAGEYLSGRAEADIAHGVLSELQFEGYAIAPLPIQSIPSPPAARPPAPPPAPADDVLSPPVHPGIGR